MGRCINCGAEVPAGSKFCMVCGLRQGMEAAPVPPTAPQNEPSSMPRQEYYAPPVAERYNPEYNQNGQYYQNYNQRPVQPQKPPIASVSDIYRRIASILRTRPVKLLGLSLLSSLLTMLAVWLCILPVISIPISLVLSVGAVSIYLSAYRGREVSSEQLFTGFKSFWRMAGGMAWMTLWIFLWSIIPIAGVVFGVIKMYSYRFTPYILLERPEISPMEALRVSMQMTKGYRGKMFVADILIMVLIIAVSLLSVLLGLIPVIGVIFVILMAIIFAAISLFMPLIIGLVGAAFYDEVERVSEK